MAVLQCQLVAAVDLELMWVQERERAHSDAPLSCPGMLLGMLPPSPPLRNRCKALRRMMSLPLLLLPQLLRWEQQPQRASMKPMLAGKAPGARRLKQDDPQELDDIPSVMLEDVVGGCLQIRGCDAHPCLQDDVLPSMFLMTMSKDLAKEDLVECEDHADATHLSAMHSAMSKMPSEKMKMDVISRCGGMESSAGRPRTDGPALLPCEIKVGSSEFLRGEFQSWISQKSLVSSQSMVRHWRPLYDDLVYVDVTSSLTLVLVAASFSGWQP